MSEPKIPGMVENILSAMGVSNQCIAIPDSDGQTGWKMYKFTKSDGTDTPIHVLFLEHKAKGILEAKRQVQNTFHCVALFHLKSNYSILFKSGKYSAVFNIDSPDVAEQISAILSSTRFANADSKVKASLAVRRIIKNMPTATRNFNNRGVFSTHYLKSRLFAEYDITVDNTLRTVHEGDAIQSLKALGWTDLEGNNGIYRSKYFPLATILVVDKGPDFGMQRSSGSVTPSYAAIAELKNTSWVILTDGTTWRLYTSKVSASTTNYFEISLETKKDTVLKYLTIIFGASSYVIKDGKAPIDEIFDDGKNYVQELEENLADRILKPDGIFVDLVKGILDHDRTRRYTKDDMQHAKETALKIMYRVWFLLYAESRDLLPVKDEKYAPLSLTSLRSGLDDMEQNPQDSTCWKRVLSLFKGVRSGSSKHNLPQYSGELFRYDSKIDGINIKNKHFARALRGLFERDGEAVDYASLGVRHLGNIYETLMEFSVRQADRDIMLLDDKKGVREVESKAESTYTYRKNDIYIVSKTGYVSRKSSGSYYTPEKLVTFLVRCGLQPIFDEREKMIQNDLETYQKNNTQKNYNTCMDRLLDIQVLDPAMGSGHFLVEALNQITSWATSILKKHPRHPLLSEIEQDRKLIISTQKEKGITINQNLLTHDVLLKRRVMKRCIFGVDINPLAVELARVSLWLDSFAIGVPLTYLSHHIKTGDSTIGAWRNNIGDAKDQSLDDWITTTDRVGDIMERVSRSADVTIEQVRSSEDAHDEYENIMESHKRMLDVWCAAQIDDSIIPSKARKNTSRYIRRFAGKVDDAMKITLRRARDLRSKYKFFHWELEMMDAFTDARYGFDAILGNPPWDTVKASDDEFFTQYEPTFRSINTKPKKKIKQNEILTDNKIKKDYDNYKRSFQEKSTFYKIYKMQGIGSRDMWQLILERMFGLVGTDGIISVLIPSQILSNTGSIGIRQHILNTDIQQIYVFENRKKIFPIDSRYRFLLLTMRNADGPDTFKAGFYLHDMQSLESGHTEKEKFHVLSKKLIQKIFPNMHIIPEVSLQHLDILAKISNGKTMNTASDTGWNAEMTSGFQRTSDANLFKDKGRGWPVLEGKNIHQFNHAFARPEFVASMSAGLNREKKKRVYKNKHREFYHSFRLAFRDIASPTNMRTIIAAIIPPQKFHTHSMMSIFLTRSGRFEQNNDYNKHMVYLCGVLNSMTFDFAARSRIQMHTSTIINTIPFPDTSLYYHEIVDLAAKLSVGSDEFEGFAESLRVENVQLSPSERIHVTANLDAFVAHAYGLTLDEYHIILDSFKFDENATLLEAEHADFNDNRTLRQFYGEVRRLAPKYFKDITEDKHS